MCREPYGNYSCDILVTYFLVTVSNWENFTLLLVDPDSLRIQQTKLHVIVQGYLVLTSSHRTTEFFVSRLRMTENKLQRQ
jgi:hypothetical protein